MGVDLLVAGVLLVTGLILSAFRWGKLGFYLFASLYHRFAKGLGAARENWRNIWTNRVLRLVLFAGIYLLLSWVGLVDKHGLSGAIALSDRQQFEYKPDWRYNLVEKGLAEQGWPTEQVQRWVRTKVTLFMIDYYPGHQDIWRRRYAKEVHKATQKQYEQLRKEGRLKPRGRK